ncbi:MAG: GNAT family N-acetyltransferase [Xanthobacteraceae bacterium]|nr:GNAT family N-acetyltransferase [Xanthobacteraceae bacterium]
MAPTDLTIGTSFADADLPAAEALVREAGWNQVIADWEIFRTLGTVHTARDDGHVVATAATLPYGNFAWISMVLVLPAYRQQGLGTRLLARCVEALDSEGRVPVLDATPAGRPIYQAMGFEDCWGYHRLARQSTRRVADAPSDATARVRPIVDADWRALCTYDAAAFGADRSALLQRLRGRLPAAELIAERDGRIAGFMLGRNGRSASQLGPLIAEDDNTAQLLLAHALSAIAGPVYLDFADAKAEIRTWLAQCGLVAQRPLTRMLYRRSSGFDDTSRTFAVVGPEFG